MDAAASKPDIRASAFSPVMKKYYINLDGFFPILSAELSP